MRPVIFVYVRVTDEVQIQEIQHLFMFSSHEESRDAERECIIARNEQRDKDRQLVCVCLCQLCLLKRKFKAELWVE